MCLFGPAETELDTLGRIYHLLCTCPVELHRTGYEFRHIVGSVLVAVVMQRMLLRKHEWLALLTVLIDVSEEETGI